MTKQITAYINLESKGNHDYVGYIAFDHANSDSLRINEIRLKARGNETPLNVPANLLTWYTKQAAGREITRDENEQQEKAAIYIDLQALKELIETCNLKNSFEFEVEIGELDRNNETLLRNDKGVIEIAINLYKGPRADYNLNIRPLASANKPLIFPNHCGKNGRFDLFNIELTSQDSPQNPETDKRVIIVQAELDAPFSHLQYQFEQRLSVYENTYQQAAEKIVDTHYYAELFPNYPLDPEFNLQPGCSAFGPLMPKDEKARNENFILSLTAPPNDPFWQSLKQRVWNDNEEDGAKQLTGTLNFIIPEPGATIQKRVPFSIAQTDYNCLILTDAAGISSPLVIPFNSTNAELEPASFELEYHLSTKEDKPTTMLSVQYYCLSDMVTPLNIAFKPNKKSATKKYIKPEILELSANQQQFLLFGQLTDEADNENQTEKIASFDVRLIWPESDFKQTFPLQIIHQASEKKRCIAIDIGSKAITIASNDQLKPEQNDQLNDELTNDIKPIRQLSSSLALSGIAKGPNGKDSENIHDVSWRASHYPFSIAFRTINNEGDEIASRLQIENRHYDIAIPSDNNPEELSIHNLRRLFLSPRNDKQSKNAKYLMAPNADEIVSNNNPLVTKNEINVDWLFEDCVDELCQFYTTYLPSEHIDQDNLSRSLELILTYSGDAPDQAKYRYKRAATKTIERYEYGSFEKLGGINELVNLPSTSSLKEKTKLLPDSVASAYHALKTRAEKDRPSRCKKIHQLHFDIGAVNCEVISLTAIIGESNTLLNEILGQISLPLGGQALELALTKEIETYLDSILSKTPLLSWQVNLPSSVEKIIAAENPNTEQERYYKEFLNEIQHAIKISSNSQQKADNDLKITLASSDHQPPNFELDQTILSETKSINLWNGLRGEQLVFTPNQNENSWELDLYLSSEVMSERVGPLSTYLAFVAEFLPNTIFNSLPKHLRENDLELYFSITGGQSLYPPLEARFNKTSHALNSKAFFKPIDFQEATTAVAEGALAFLESGAHTPYKYFNPNLILATVSSQQDAHINNLFDLTTCELANITAPEVYGNLSPSITKVLLIETISGLNTLLKQAPSAIQCRTYLNDLDRASDLQWQLAEEQWNVWISNCYQILLNMPINEPDNMNERRWDYIALKENQARLIIAGHDYFLSSGLRATGN